MFLNFLPLSLIRNSDPRRKRPGRRVPDRNRARLRLEGLEDRRLLSGISSISEYNVPTSGASPYSIVSGPDGNVWFTEIDAEKVGKINPTTDHVTEYSIPSSGGFGPYGIAVGPDGDLWFTQQFTNTIGKINPTTGAITQYTLPSGASETEGITAGPDSNLWFADLGTRSIGTINPTTDVITEYPIPFANAAPQTITAGPDGNLWFTDQGTKAIGKITVGGSITEYPVSSTSPPYGITAGPDGNLWFGDKGTRSIDDINPTTGVISQFTISSTSALPVGITAGPDGNIWFTDQASGKLGEINPTTDAITEFKIAATNSEPAGITTGPDGRLWFADYGANAIGAAALASSQFVVTQSPPSSETAGSGFGMTVEAEDNSGNLLSSYNGPVTVAIANNPGGATLGGTLTTTATNGMATFSGLSLNLAATGYTLQVSASGFSSGWTGSINVTPAAASQVVVTQPPPFSVTAGETFSVRATIEDAFGNVVTSASNLVSLGLASNPGGATLIGTTSATATQGQATFSNLSVTKAATSDTILACSGTLTGGTSDPFAVIAAAASKLLITQQPTSVVVNAGFALVVEAVDAYGNVVTSDNTTVTVALGNNPSGGKLGGTLSLKFVNGVATFSGLTLNKAGTGSTLVISSKNLTGATTNAINVTSS